MPLWTRLTRGTTVVLGLVALLLAACTAPAAAPPPAATARPAAASTASSTVPVSPSASARPSPALTTASVQPSPVAILAPATPVGTEQPLAPETSPVGDIPDNQAFVAFASPTGGYRLQVPEGWARTDTGSDVRFVSKLDGVEVTLTSASAAPNAASAQTGPVADLLRSGRAVQVNMVQDVQLPGGPAVLVDYSSNSDPDPVTGKQVRLENNAYLLYRNGKLAMLTLWAPQGADNVDQWKQMSESFRWQ